MAEGSVNLLLSKLAQILEEEGQLLTGVRTEAEYISDELEFMKAFLRVADAMEERDPRLEVLVKKVRDIARVIGISEAHRRYLIRNNIMGQGSTFSSISRLESQGDGLLLEEADLVGIEKPKRQLIEWLLERKSGREVVSVVGMGGLGKSTLVKKVYDDPDVKKQFKFRAWITVSQSFKKEELLKDIIQQLFRVHRKPGPKGVDSMDYDKLRTVINKFLQQKKYLIVLDDVWHTSAWGAFQHALPNNNCGSRIMVTTRNTEVASTACMDFPDRVFPLDPLSQEESWILFCKKIFQNNTCPPHLKNVSETILGRCEGLPLAIVSISGVLAAKNKNKIDEWEMVHRSLGNPIERMKLIRLWIAEGFAEGKEGMTLEEVADDYLNELIKRSLVRVVEATSDGRVKTCRIHDLLREIMITKAKDQDFVAIAKEEGMMWSEKVRRVSIHKAVSSIQRRHGASRLRSVLIFWGADSCPDSPAPNLSFGHLRLLNVLDLEGAPLKEFPSKVSSLFLLKYLSLRNTNVNSIPSSISKLLNLETLDLKYTLISELPVEILKLRKLRHLLVYRYEIDSDDRIPTKYGFQPPPQIGSLQSLQKLCFVEANQGGDLLLELGRLNQLRRLGIVKFRKEHGKDLCSSVTKLTDLRALSITSVTDSEFIDLEYLSNPPRFLQRLYLTGPLQRLTEWLHSLDSLVKLVLKWSRLTSAQSTTPRACTGLRWGDAVFPS
ncbi:disease resistance protein RPM1-like [Populus alba x Populus x berolinensis]|nr:disease resistance protein RPM1-like [Populus alba x Populus x berolinensis]